MRKTQTLLSALIICMTVCSSFTTPQKNDDESPVNTATSLIDAGEYRLALRTLKDCDALFADALRMEACNGLNRTKKAIRYGVEYLDELGRQHIKDSTVSLSSYVSTEVQDVLSRNWKYASRQIQKRLAGQEYNTQLQMMQGSLYKTNGLYDEAIEQYDKVMDYCRGIGLRDFGTDWLCVWKSDCYYVLEDYDNAVKTISQAIEANNSRTTTSFAGGDSTICSKESSMRQWRITQRQQRSIQTMLRHTLADVQSFTCKGNWMKQGRNTAKVSR